MTTCEMDFGRVCEEHWEKVYGYVFNQTHDREVADELTQDIFTKASAAIGRLSLRVPIGAWLHRIAHNHLANHWRTASRRPQFWPIPDSPTWRAEYPDVEDQIIAQEETLELHQVIAGLSQNRQRLIFYKHVLELPNEEIAALMNNSVGGVKALYHRTLVELRATLSKYDQ